MKSEILLELGLARLQLPFFAKHHAAISSEAAQAAWSHGRFLETLVVGEVARRDEALIPRVRHFSRVNCINEASVAIKTGSWRSAKNFL